MNYHTPLPAFSSYGVPPSQGWVQLNRERQAVEANLQTMANQERAASPYVAELLAALVKDCADGSQRACSDLRKVRGSPPPILLCLGAYSRPSVLLSIEDEKGSNKSIPSVSPRSWRLSQQAQVPHHSHPCTLVSQGLAP